MGLRERAIADIQKIITDKTTGPGVDLTFVSRNNSSVTATIVGIHTRHHLTITSEGMASNDLNAHCSFSEAVLSGAGYPVRNGSNQVDIIGDIMHAVDSAGINRKYKIAQVHPDETFGLIRCILEDCL